LAQSGEYDFVFYGHTHKPWISDIDVTSKDRKKCTMLNPGNVAGDYYLPTFALWDTQDNNLNLIKIHDLK
jgi:predicted phosphodiesterase